MWITFKGVIKNNIMFVIEFAASSKKDITFDSGFKPSRPLAKGKAAPKVSGFFFGLYEALMAAATKRCTPLIEGSVTNHLNGIDGLSTCKGIICHPIPASLKLYGYLIRCNWREQVSSFGGRGKLAFSRLLSYRFLFSAIDKSLLL